MASNTGSNRGQFKKGDPRINRKGRPKTFDALRALAQQIAHEAALKDGQSIVISGHVVTVTEAILRQWAASKNAKLQQGFLEVAYGKVPDRHEHSGPEGGPIEHRFPQFDKALERIYSDDDDGAA